MACLSSPATRNLCSCPSGLQTPTEPPHQSCGSPACAGQPVGRPGVRSSMGQFLSSLRTSRMCMYLCSVSLESPDTTYKGTVTSQPQKGGNPDTCYLRRPLEGSSDVSQPRKPKYEEHARAHLRAQSAKCLPPVSGGVRISGGWDRAPSGAPC